MTTELDSFERRLLADLRAEVEARSAGPATTRMSPARRRALAAAAVAALAGGGLAVPALLGGSPAYAVGSGPGGVIELRVDRLEDAEGLEQALEQRGVHADVQYLGTDLRCQADRYEPSSRSVPDSRTGYSVGGGIRVQLDPRDIGKGDTLVIAASTISPAGDQGGGVTDGGGVYGEVGIAHGPVEACVPEPLEVVP